MSQCSEKLPEIIKRDRADLRAILRAPEARRVMWRVLRQSNLLNASLYPGDALGTAYNEGLRAVGLWLRDEIESAAPGEFARLLLENTAIKEDING